ncbi:hypothetical protein FACS189490_12270 [Clostridia bacterium]|nr:hypothetical protein FACS189490_12270 [Clostridia bacterium]
MKRMVAAVVSIALLAGCSALDVVQKDAVRAFGDILEAYAANGDSGNYRLVSPDGDASFIWSPQDVALSFSVEPFIKAGLDFSKLDTTIYNGDESAFFIHTGSFNMLNQNVKETAIEQFAEALKYKRDSLGYHDALGHYNLGLGAAMFEWAKDMSTNDKDIVFVLNPEPLIAAGVDPEEVEGWTYAQVSVEENGKSTQVWKLLKPFDLK